MSAPIVYFHGLPGGPEEWNACAPSGLAAFVPDRNVPIDPPALAAAIVGQCGEGPVRLVGFSLGAPVALAVANELGGQIAGIDLVSPAAPLQLGDFLSQMAGGPLFSMAARRPRLFRAVVAIESRLARMAPGFLFDRLFATASGGDAPLRRDPVFRAQMAQVLRNGLGRDSRGFASEVCAYVGEWRIMLEVPGVPVTIWQGQADNWTPPNMTEALAKALPGPVTVNRLPGLSHYSTLRHALAHLA